jgi:hypothetical protein
MRPNQTSLGFMDAIPFPLFVQYACPQRRLAGVS